MKGEREYKIIVPKFDNSDNKISSDELKELATRMAHQFGGITVIPVVIGCWKPEKTEDLVCEENAIFIVYRDMDDTVRRTGLTPEVITKKDEKFIKELSAEIAKRFGQYEVIEVTNVLRDVERREGVFKEKLSRELIEKDLFARKLDL